MSSIKVSVERNIGGSKKEPQILEFEYTDGKLTQVGGEPNQDPVTFCLGEKGVFGYRIVPPPGVNISGVIKDRKVMKKPANMAGKFNSLKKKGEILVSLEYSIVGENRNFGSITISRAK